MRLSSCIRTGLYLFVAACVALVLVMTISSGRPSSLFPNDAHFTGRVPYQSSIIASHTPLFGPSLQTRLIPMAPYRQGDTNLTIVSWYPLDDSHRRHDRSSNRRAKNQGRTKSSNIYIVSSTEPWSVLIPEPENTTLTGVPRPRRRRHLLMTSNTVTTPNTLGQHGHPTLSPTLQQAKTQQCRFATNGGPFHADGTSLGTLIVQHRILQSGVDPALVGFGSIVQPTTTTITQSQWIVGRVEDLAPWQRSRVSFFVTGFEWLVYDGVSVTNTSSTRKVGLADRAPRTAVGVTNDGKLLQVVSDGCEQCPGQFPGLTLLELANVLIEQGAMYAINMDGGGSSELVGRSTKTDEYDVLSRPTCTDVLPWICERPVATVLCIG